MYLRCNARIAWEFQRVLAAGLLAVASGIRTAGHSALHRGEQSNAGRSLHKGEYIQIISRSGCSVHAAPGLKRAPRTREISTWKSVQPATRFSPASKSW